MPCRRGTTDITSALALKFKMVEQANILYSNKVGARNLDVRFVLLSLHLEVGNLHKPAQPRVGSLPAGTVLVLTEVGTRTNIF